MRLNILARHFSFPEKKYNIHLKLSLDPSPFLPLVTARIWPTAGYLYAYGIRKFTVSARVIVT